MIHPIIIAICRMDFSISSNFQPTNSMNKSLNEILSLLVLILLKLATNIRKPETKLHI